jgi:hypothetical protein
LASSKYIVDVFDDIVAAVRAEYDTTNNLEPYYIYGHPREIANRLALKDQDSVDKFRKFPLIVLIVDVEESHGNDDTRIDYTTSPTLLIVTNTQPTYTSEERYDNTFKPTLYPIYELLVSKMNESPSLHTQSTDDIIYTKIDRLFWGSATVNGNEGLIFNDFLDAIELNFSDLNIIKDNECQQ